MPRTTALARVFAALLLAALHPPAALAQVTEGDASNGSTTQGTASNGSTTEGSASNGSTTEGSASSGGANTLSYDAGTPSDLGGGTVTLATAILNGGTVTNGTLNVSGSIDARSGSISAQLAGTAYMVKTTTDTLTLSGANTFTGSVNIVAGTLVLNGSVGSGAVFWVSDGGTLAGSGTINKPTTVFSGGIIAPGNSPGTLTYTDGLALAAGAVLDFELGSVSDLIRVTGGTLIGPDSGTVQINLIDAGDFGQGNYTLIDFAGATPANFDASDFAIANAPSSWIYDIFLDGNTLRLGVTAVPEPAAAALLVGAGSALVIGVRRRRRQGDTPRPDRS